MNVIEDKMKRNININRAMVVKPTVIGNQLMPPPQSAKKNFITPSSSRSRPKEYGTSSESHTKSTPTVHRDSHIIASICEGRGKATGIVGIAAIDIYRPVLILSQISDTQTYTSTLTKLNILRPVEILVPATFIDGATPSRIVTIIINQFPNLSVNAISRSEFNKEQGLQLIQSICAANFKSVILQISDKFYSLAASGALLRYVEHSRRVLYSPNTVKVQYQEPEYTTAIDIDTAEILDLVCSSGKRTTLFNILDYCCTIPGKKLLRANILQPPCRKNIIETRLDCVQELIENPNLLTRLQETLKPLFDIEASLTFGTVVPATASSVSERQLNYTLQLKGLLNAIQPLADELKATKHPAFKDIYHCIEGLDTRKKILKLISEIIKEDAHLSKGHAGELQRCFAIKCGINDFLDLSRRLYTEGVDNMRSYVDELAAKHNLPLRVQHTIKNGFHIILPLTKALNNLKKTDLPAVFLKAERYSSHYYLTTKDMLNYDKRLKKNSAEIQNISNVIIYKLLIDIRPNIGDLYNLCDQIAQLDMLVSLARASSVPHWIRPRLVDTHMHLEGARHPILEHVDTKETVSNSIYAYPRCNLHVITGPNMSGKSVLLHAICLVQVLSQLGSFVPCARAAVRVCERVCVRAAQDGGSCAASSFAQEARRLSYLLASVSASSLVALDELCKTTANDEGIALATAVCEALMKRGCFTFVASHFITLTLLGDMYPNVANWHLETLEEYRAHNTRISLKFTYRLLPGVTTVDSYGIKLSRIFNSSKSISDRAESLYKYLLPLRKSLTSESASNNPEFLKFKLQAELDLLQIKNQLTEQIQNEKIINFQNRTGLKFEVSPLTVERSNSNPVFDQTSSSEKKSSPMKKKSTSSENSWFPTFSDKSENSNHEFSIPNSVNNQNLEKSSSKNMFSIDDTSFQIYSDLIFPEKNNFLFYNSTNDCYDITFPSSPPANNTFTEKSILENEDNWTSAGNTLLNKTLKSLDIEVDATHNYTESISQQNDTISILDSSAFNINAEKTNLINQNSPNIPKTSSGSIFGSPFPVLNQNSLNTSYQSKITSSSTFDSPYPVFNPEIQISRNQNTLNTKQSRQTSGFLFDSPYPVLPMPISRNQNFLNMSKQSKPTSGSPILVLNSEIPILGNQNSLNTSKQSRLTSDSTFVSPNSVLNSEILISRNKNSLNVTKQSRLPSDSPFPVLNSEIPILGNQNSLNTSKQSRLTSGSSVDSPFPVLNTERNQNTTKHSNLTSNSIFDTTQNCLNVTNNSIKDLVSPILDHKNKTNVRLVSELYDSDSNDSDSSVCPDELHFNKQLSLHAATSTPKLDKLFADATTEYFTSNSLENTATCVQTPNTFIYSNPESIFGESPIIRHRSIPGINKIKKQKIDNSSVSFQTCVNTSNVSKSNDGIFEEE